MAIDLTGYRITVLCEDINQFDFICAYAKLCGANKRNINRLTQAHNNATVLTHYPQAVTSHRPIATYQNVILIVMIDADEKTVPERLREFDKKLDVDKHALNQKTRDDNEKILLLVPSRNIESWFRYIDKDDQNVEITKGSDGKIISYKDDYPNDAKITAFAEKLKNVICINGLPENSPSSLHHACEELKRLK